MKVVVVGSPARKHLSAASSVEEVSRATGNNIGNLLFQEAVTALLVEPDEIDWDAFVGSPGVARGADLLVLPAANHLGDSFSMDGMREALEELGAPVLVVGLGGQARTFDPSERITSDSCQRWLDTVQRLRPDSAVSNILTRGRWSHAWLASLDVESVAGMCPSIFWGEGSAGMLDVERKTNRRPRSVAVLAGDTGWHWLRDVERALVDVVLSNPSECRYIVQADPALLDIAQSSRSQSSVDAFRSYALPLVPEEILRERLLPRFVYFTDGKAWARALRVHDLALGMRFHGVMASRCSGTPGLVLAHDARMWELALETGTPVVSWTQVEHVGLDGAMALNADAVAKHARILEMATAKYATFWTANGLPLDAFSGGGHLDTDSLKLDERCSLTLPPGIEGPGNCMLDVQIEESHEGGLFCKAHCPIHLDAAPVLEYVPRGGVGELVQTVRAATTVGAGFAAYIQSSAMMDIFTIRDVYGRKVVEVRA